MQKTFHPRDNIDWLYMSRKRRMKSIEHCVDASIQRLKDYTEKRRGRLFTATRNNTDNTRINRITVTRKKWEEKQLYGDCKQQTSDISHEKTWTSQRKRNFKKETETLLIATQKNDRKESINHIISECCKLTQKRLDTTGWARWSTGNWARNLILSMRTNGICKKQESFRENDTHKLLWDFVIQTDHQISPRRPDQVIGNKKKKNITCRVVDSTVPTDRRLKSKKSEKRHKNLDFLGELKKKNGAWKWR